MVTLLVTLGDCYPQTTQFLHFALPFTVGEHRDFKSCVHVDHSRFQPMDDKPFLKGA